MGGDGGVGGRWYALWSPPGPSVRPGAIGFGIAISSACDIKMFLPLPSYCVFSLEASRSSRNVGSRLSTRAFFPSFNAAFPGRGGGACGKVGAAAWALEVGVDDPVNKGMT